MKISKHLIFLFITLLTATQLHAASGSTTITTQTEQTIDGIAYYLKSSKDGNIATVIAKSYYQGDIVIPSEVTYENKVYTVTGIGSKAFSASSVSSIVLPSTITYIDNEAFSNCKSLSSINLPTTLTKIGARAFSNCTRLSSIIFPNSLLSIGNYAFEGCVGLTNISLPNSIIEIGTGIFYNCINLTKPLYTDKIFAHYPQNAAQTSYSIPDGIEKIASASFYKCSNLTDIFIPNSVTQIGSSAFSNCVNLANIELSHSLAQIGESAFYQCKALKRIILPGSLKTIGEQAFVGCTNLKLVINLSDILISPGSKYDGYVAYYSDKVVDGDQTVGEFVFKKYPGKEYSYLIYYFGDSEFVNLPENYNGESYGIYDDTFSECSFLKKIYIPNSVKSIGYNAFLNCANLTDITIASSTADISKYAFTGCRNLLSFSSNTANTQTSLSLDVKRGSLTGHISAYIYVYRSTSDEKFLFKTEVKSTQDEFKINGLNPGSYYFIKPMLEINGMPTVIAEGMTMGTKAVNISLSAPKVTASSIYVEKPTVYKSDAQITNQYWVSEGERLHSDELILTGLDPETKYTPYYCIEGESNGGWYNTKSLSATTQKLTIATLPAEAMNTTTALLCAETNLSDEEENTGFEWRRYDAPASLPSSKVKSAVTDGKLMGALGNLNPGVYYNFRPYYISNSGKEYYGEWLTCFTGDATVFFDPTVRTYSAEKVGTTSAELKGYALRGSEDIARQGFQYWIKWGSRISTDINEIEVNGQKIACTVNNLTPATEYCYRTFVETKSGVTYGEEMAFTTEGQTGIHDLESDNAATEITGYYNLQGFYSETPFKGINIVRMSDGTTRKVNFR